MSKFTVIVNVTVVGSGNNPQVFDVSDNLQVEADDFTQAAQMGVEGICEIDSLMERKYRE